MLLVIGRLPRPAALGFADRGAHRVGVTVRIHDHTAVEVARGAPGGLDQGAGRAQEPFLVGIENGHQRHFGQVEALAQQVDPDQHVEHAAAQVAQNGHPLQGVDVGVQIAHLHAQFLVIRGEVLGHSLGERGDQHPFLTLGAVANLLEQIVDLALDRPYFDRRIHQAGRPDHLFDHHPAGLLEFVGAGRR